MKEGNVKHNLVHVILNSDLGQHVQRAALEEHKNEQGHVMHLDGQEESTAHTWDLILKRENVKHNLVLSMVVGVNGQNGQVAVKHVEMDRKLSQEYATVPRQHSVVQDVLDIRLFMPLVTSYLVQSMEYGLDLDHGYLAANHVEEESKRKLENAQIPPLNIMEKLALELQKQVRNVTLIHVQSMVDGRNGLCGDHAARHVEEDEHTDNVSARTPHRNMEERDVQGHQFKPNNVEPYSVQSMVTGIHSVLMKVAVFHVVVVPN